MSKITPYISVKNLRKTFGKVVANANVNLEVMGGEIHALLGENGAGKSTLINMLSGVYAPEDGVIEVHGKPVVFTSPKDALLKGVGTIYQHFKLVEAMTARENIILSEGKGVFLNKKNIDSKVKELCNTYDLKVDLDKYVMDMSVGERQNLEILKVLYRGADILILDEPTAVFTPQETKKLFNIMRRMKEKGAAVIFITHKMDEVMEICDSITVLRKGESVRTLKKEETNPKELADLMVGRKLDLSIKRVETKKGETVLAVKNLKVISDGVEALKDINFSIREGEVLGVAGIAGAGQKELCEAIAGVTKCESGEIIFLGEHLEGKDVREFIKRGISMSFVPEDRLGMGLVASMDMVDNLLLKSYKEKKGILVDRKSLIPKAKELVETLEIKTPSINYPIRYLSGGNIQKILLGRELSLRPKVLIMAYPVRGLDVNTCHTIYNLINEEKKKGTAILFVGEDLDVLMELCDRIMVLCGRTISGFIDSKNATRDKLGLMMVGADLNEDKGGVAVG